ncbi:MAG: hypothetical protein QXM96_00145 [Candidatus Woesearchaeota archaeon]
MQNYKKENFVKENTKEIKEVGTKLPEKKFRIGPISATIWKNQTEKNGSVVEYSTISFERSYQKNGEWQTTNSLRFNDLPRAVLVLQKAYEYLAIKDISED